MHLKCALSNEPMESPVVSPVSGAVYEHRLITKYLMEKGPVDPITGQSLRSDQLVRLNQKSLLLNDPKNSTDLNSNTLNRSVPEVLRFLQDQWDSMLLLVFELRTQLESHQTQLIALDQEHERKKQLIESLRSQLNTTRQQLDRVRTRSCSITEESSGSSHRSSPLDPEPFQSNPPYSHLTVSSLPPTPVKRKSARFAEPYTLTCSVRSNDIDRAAASRSNGFDRCVPLVPPGSTCVNTNERFLPDNFDRSVQLSRRLANSVADFSSDVIFVESMACNNPTANARPYCSTEYINLSAEGQSNAEMNSVHGLNQQRSSVAVSDRSARSASSRDELLLLHNANRRTMMSESCQDVTLDRSIRCASVYSNWSELSATSAMNQPPLARSSECVWNVATPIQVGSSEGIEPEVEYENLQEIKKSIELMNKRNSSNVAKISSLQSGEATASDHNGLVQNGPDETKQVGRIEGWATNFEKLIRDSMGINLFTEHLRTEHSVENIEFWLACEKFKTIENEEEIKKEAKKIYEKFVKSKVNLSDSPRKKIEQQLNKANKNIFIKAQEEIFNLMKNDPYKRFLKSESYRKCVDCAKTGCSLPIELFNRNQNQSINEPDTMIQKKQKRKSFVNWNKQKLR